MLILVSWIYKEQIDGTVERFYDLPRHPSIHGISPDSFNVRVIPETVLVLMSDIDRNHPLGIIAGRSQTAAHGHNGTAVMHADFQDTSQTLRPHKTGQKGILGFGLRNKRARPMRFAVIATPQIDLVSFGPCLLANGSQIIGHSTNL